MSKKITGYIILGVTVLLVIFDVYAFMSAENSTLSVVITDWSRVYPSVAFVAGLLCGHWFFPAKGSED